MNNAIEEQNYKGYNIKIYQDEDPLNPRTEWDNFGHMVCFHGRYTLGDKHTMSIEDVKDILGRSDVVALPLYLYDHSGITMSCKPFSCPWDSGQVGIIYVTYEEIKKEFSIQKVTPKYIEKIRKVLMNEVETYDKYLRGDVLGYVIEKDGRDIDSCWGFYDSVEYLVTECQSHIDYDIENEDKQQNLINKVVAL